MARRKRPSRKQRQQSTAADNSKLDTLLESPEGTWRSARMLASTVFGTFAPAIDALMPRFFEARDGIGMGITTMGVDKYYRVYVNNGFTLHLVKRASEISVDNPCPTCGATEHHELAYVAGVICHEAQHPVREHSNRADEINVSDHRSFNVAADWEINDDLLETFIQAYKDHQALNLPYPQLCLPKNVCLPKYFREQYPQHADKFPDDQIAEVYYSNLRNLIAEMRQQQAEQEKKQQQKQQGKQQRGGSSDDQDGDQGEQPPKDPQDLTDEELEKIYDGSGDMMDNNGQDCGSGAHGQESDYEDGDPGADNPGISEAENEAIQREIAKNLEEEQNTRGTVPAGMRRWAEKVLAPPKHDWRKEFAKKVRKAVNRAWGHEVRTWRRLGRNSAATNYRYLSPSSYTPVPKIGIVLDTSGSMGGGQAGSRLHIACSEVQGICKQVGAQVTFLSVDAQAGEVTEINNFQDAVRKGAMTGGGGTDMRVGIASMEDMDDPPQVCVVLTDGETPWPDRKPRKDMDVIAAIVGHGAKHEAQRVPSWMGTVVIDD